MKRLVLFDIDGTILFSRGLGKQALVFGPVREHVPVERVLELIP